MRFLEKDEVKKSIWRSRNAPENKITAILDELEKDHPEVYRLIYDEPYDAIASMNKDMANLYLDLSFDVVWVFRDAFGNPPSVENEEEWMLSKLSLLDAELKSLTEEIPMDDNFRRNLQERFIKRSIGTKLQIELLRYLGDEVKKYASFDKNRVPAIKFTTYLLFVLVRLMGDLYSLKATESG